VAFRFFFAFSALTVKHTEAIFLVRNNSCLLLGFAVDASFAGSRFECYKIPGRMKLSEKMLQFDLRVLNEFSSTGSGTVSHCFFVTINPSNKGEVNERIKVPGHGQK
jgi:hypothetical protein